MQHSRAAVPAATAALLVALLSACSTSPSYDAGALTTQISDKLTSVVPGSTVKVNCPTDVTPSPGTTFDCEATVNGQSVTMVVTPKDDQGNVSFANKQALILLDKAQTSIAAEVTKQVPGKWAIACDPTGASGGLYVADPGATFDCTITGTTAQGQAQKGTLVVTVKDSDGNVEWKVKQ